MKKFQIESSNFQIAISNDWRWGHIPEWDEESLSQGFTATEHNVYVGTAGDDYSHSAFITITVFNPDEFPEPAELKEYVAKGTIPFVSGYKKMSFLPSLSTKQEKVTLTLNKPHASFRLWIESNDYPTRIIICLKDAYTSMS
jgi:hypothetical protein